MSATVTVELQVFSDYRFPALARELGVSFDSALVAMMRLWGEVTRRNAQIEDDDAPDLYHLPATVCGAILGVSHDEAERILVLCELGEATPDGIRLKGTRGRTEWMRRDRRRSRKGGRARADAARGGGGRFVSDTTLAQPRTSQEPPRRQPRTTPTTTATTTATATRASDAAHPGERFRVSRERARKSQDEIARAHLAVTPRQLSKWERGQIDLDPMVVEQLEAILARSAPAAPAAHPDHAAFVAWFTDEWREFQGQPAGPTWNSRTGAQVRERLQGLGLEELKRRARHMFEKAAAGQWPCKDRSDAAWGTLYRCTDNLVTGARKAPGQFTMPTLEDFEREAERERQENER